jgi:lysyl-tRNA synthetase class 2
LEFHEALRARATLNQEVRAFFIQRDFLEVETPILVPSPGTDVFLDVFETEFRSPDFSEKRYLQTSPEFAMKALLVKGCRKIYQITKAFRNGESSERHNTEFTILEWYRANDGVDTIIEDVKNLVVQTCKIPPEKFRTITMADLFIESCQIDIREAQTKKTLEIALKKTVGLPSFVNSNSTYDWNDLFFHTLVKYVEPHLEKMGTVFVTEWPTRLAVLAQTNQNDPRVADRFELYIDGLEIANGFQELRDVDEQRSRFEEDNLERKRLGKPELPMPTAFLNALKEGLPKSAGVALGMDRLLMVAENSQNIHDFLPFAYRPNFQR